MALIVLAGASEATAQLVARRVPAAPAAPGMINLPYQVSDNTGGMWSIVHRGQLQQQGNNPLFSQGGMITINGSHPSTNNNQARLEANGEVVLENLTVGQLRLVRRISVAPDGSYVRYIDVIHNPANQDARATVMIQTSLNFGVPSAQMVRDPRRPNNEIGWIGLTHQGRAGVEMFAGKGSKFVPQITWQQGNNQVQAVYNIEIPARGQTAIFHLRATADSVQDGERFIASLNERQVLRDVDKDLKRHIVNVIVPSEMIGERELLRGTLFDVIELRSGDLLNGTLLPASYKLNTAYGTVDLPADRIIAMFNVGQFRPRQLLVSGDGEIFGGEMVATTVGLRLASGQEVEVPLSHISRFGYRKRDGEPEEIAFDKPFVQFRDGDRLAIEPSIEFQVMTRYGPLQVPPSALAAVTFDSPEHSVHLLELTDGSRLSGLVAAGELSFTLRGAAGSAVVNVPVAMLSRVQHVMVADEESERAAARLNNGDRLCGMLDGQMKLTTAFDTITINAPEVRGITRVGDGGMDVQITLWDNTALSGQLHEAHLALVLGSGLRVSLPVSLLQEYANPEPRPAREIVQRVLKIVEQLSAEDWQQRERAEAQLVSMGQGVAGLLREVQSNQNAEAAQRIDSVLRELEKQRGR
jgi:hypothetical protein